MIGGWSKGVTSAVRAADAGQALKLSAEVVVVGTGAGGASVLHTLAEAGVDVLGVELGTWYEPSPEPLSWTRWMSEGGARATEDAGVAVFGGRAVGGSTVLGANICRRPPKGVLEEWAYRFGLEHVATDDFEADLQAIEGLLGAAPIDPAVLDGQPNHAAFMSGLAALGYRGGALSHNRTEACQSSGRCVLGCQNGGKRHMGHALVPAALASGARLLIEARVDRVIRAEGRVCGVSGYAVDPVTGTDVAPFVIEASRVVLAAGAMASPAIVERSVLPDPFSLSGSNLHFNPGSAVLGFFEGPDHVPLRSWRGHPMAAECTQFLETAPGGGRVWLASGFAPPEAVAAFAPGMGPSLSVLMSRLPQAAGIFATIADASSGRVVAGRGERIHARYHMSDEDRVSMALALRESARIMLAAGATSALVPLSPALWVRTEADAERITPDKIGPHSPSLVSTHPSSTLAMGKSPSSSVVDPSGQHHHVVGLYAADASILPTALGVPPILTIAAMARAVARSVKASL